MRTFTDSDNHEWVATAREEPTPRYHGRWSLAFHPADDPTNLLFMPEVRWHTRSAAEHAIRAMSLFELRRRLLNLRGRVPGARAFPPGARTA